MLLLRIFLSEQILQQLVCLDFYLPYVRIYLNQGSWRLVFVEVTVEVYLVSHFTGIAVPVIGVAGVYPGIGHMRSDLSIEIVINIGIKGNPLVIAQISIRLWISTAIQTSISCLVSLTQCSQDGSSERSLYGEIREFQSFLQ